MEQELYFLTVLLKPESRISFREDKPHWDLELQTEWSKWRKE